MAQLDAWSAVFCFQYIIILSPCQVWLLQASRQSKKPLAIFLIRERPPKAFSLFIFLIILESRHTDHFEPVDITALEGTEDAVAQTLVLTLERMK